MISMASALSITNGDFENQFDSPTSYDIAYWYDYGGPDVDRLQGPWFLNHASSINGTKVVNMGTRANEEEDGGNHSYVYQSIGMYDGYPPVVDIELDWGLASGKAQGNMGVGVQILESDGTFEPGEWDGAAHDIYGFIKTDEKPDNPVTLIGRGSVLRYARTGVVHHESFQIDLSSATIGNELFLRFNNIHGGGSALPLIQVDNITLSPAYVVNQSPAEGASYVATELDSSENDLVFYIVDDTIIEVDVLFGPENDPNLSDKPAYKIVEGMPVTPGLNTVTLEAELAEDLEWSTEYFWKVLAYESDGMGGRSLKYTGLITSFTTIQKGPLLYGVTPAVAGVWPGDNAVFTVPSYVKTDTFQWYKEGNPNPLVNGSQYSGVDSNSLTVLDVQLVDEGTYYCVGTETATGLTAATLSPGVLFIKELKAHYPFETTAGGYTPDIIGGKNMQLMGGASVVAGPTDPNALLGGYLSLVNPRGVTHTQYAQIADTSVAHYPDITISFWAKPTILDLDYERYARIFDFGTPDAENYLYVMVFERTNEAEAAAMLQGSERSFRATGEIGYGTKWLYVVLTIEDGVGKLYINGQYGGEGNLRRPSDISKTIQYIGKAINETDSPPNFNGLIDELKIYNYVKTTDQIAQEYMAFRTDVEFICNMDDYDLEAWDFDGNCRIDIPDLLVIAEKWLQNYLVYFD